MKILWTLPLAGMMICVGAYIAIKPLVHVSQVRAMLDDCRENQVACEGMFVVRGEKIFRVSREIKQCPRTLSMGYVLSYPWRNDPRIGDTFFVLRGDPRWEDIEKTYRSRDS